MHLHFIHSLNTQGGKSKHWQASQAQGYWSTMKAWWCEAYSSCRHTIETWQHAYLTSHLLALLSSLNQQKPGERVDSAKEALIGYKMHWTTSFTTHPLTRGWFLICLVEASDRWQAKGRRWRQKCWVQHKLAPKCVHSGMRGLWRTQSHTHWSSDGLH